MRKIKLFKSVIILIAICIFIVSCKKEDEKPVPIANLTFTGDNKPAPCEVSFSNSSTNATSYNWEFGDGTSSTEQNPKHIYTTGGTFKVKLTATGAGGTNSTTKSVLIQNPIPVPVANYTITGDNNFAPCKVTFTNTSTNATTYIWEFGDGETSEGQSPNHIYANGGTYNVTLTAKNSAGVQNLINKTVTIKNVPTKLKIKSIILTAMPFTNTSGLLWDGGSGPDVYIQITDNLNTNLTKTSKFNDITQSGLPLTFTLGTPFTLTSFSLQYVIKCYDEDDDLFDVFDDLIGSHSISIQSNMPINGNPYPTTIELKSATSLLKYTLNVEWLL